MNINLKFFKKYEYVNFPISNVIVNLFQFDLFSLEKKNKIFFFENAEYMIIS